MRSLWNLNQLIVFEITKNLPLKDKIRLSGVCKELHRKIHFKNAMGEYICLKTPGIEEILFETIQKIVEMKLVKIAILVKSIININIRGNGGYTALIFAARHGNTKTVEILLDYGADANIQTDRGETALIWATSRDHLEIISLLLEGGANANIQNDYKNTALMLAVTHGKTETVELFLDNGVDAYLKNFYGNTLLTMAIRRKEFEIVKLLEKHQNY